MASSMKSSYNGGLKASKSSEEVARSAAQLLVSTIIVVSILLVISLIRFFLNSPVFCSAMAGVGTMLWHYLTKSTSYWHKTQNLENQFWMLTSFFFSVTALFVPDSPFVIHTWETLVSLGLPTTTCGVLLVLGSVTLSHYVDKSHHRKSLVRQYRLNETPSSLQLNMMPLEHAKEQVKVLQASIEELDYMLPSSFHNMINLERVVSKERQIIDIFRDCSRRELNYIVHNTELRLLLYKMKNHNKSTGASSKYSKMNRSRSELLSILAEERVSELTTGCKVIVLDTIQGLRFTSHPDIGHEAEQFIENILLKTKGDALSDLKSLIDNKGSVLSMHKLIYEDISDPDIRAKVLGHINKQAATQRAHMAMGTPVAKRRVLKSAWRKVISDVDDTLLSSGGRYPAGMDRSYPHHVIYPGAMCFYKELDLGNHPSVDENNGEWPASRLGNMVFLSARPHIYKDMVEKSVYHKFEKLVNAKDLHAMPTLLPGDVESGQSYMLRGDFEPMAKKKLKNFQEYQSAYPEFTHVFIGDNGQADVKAAEYMVQEYGRQVVEAVYIHQVQDQRSTFGYTTDSTKRWEEQGIVFYNTFVGAALHAAEHNLIRVKGLRRVALASKDDFEKIIFKSLGQAEENRKELNRDLQRANMFLKSRNELKISLLPAVCEYPVGTGVVTPFGTGFVKSFRPLDGIYGVVLDWDKEPLVRKSSISSIGAEDLVMSPREDEDTQSLPGTMLLHRSPTLVHLTRDRLKRSKYELYRSKKRRVYQHYYPGTNDHKPEAKHFTLGDVVHTPFGPAKVLRFRAYDGIYELDLVRFKGKAYLDSSCVSEVPVTKAGISRFSSGIASFIRKLTVTSSPPKEQVAAFEVGQLVETNYGDGTIIKYRHDLIYEIKMKKFQATIYVREECVIACKISEPVATQSRLSALMQKFTTPKPRQRENERVTTAYGAGKIQSFRDTDNMYYVELDWGARLYVGEAGLEAPKREKGLKKNQDSSLRRGLKFLIGLPKLYSTDETKQPPQSELGNIGDMCMTPFGRGQVSGYRDNVVVVKLSFGLVYIPTSLQEPGRLVTDGYSTDPDQSSAELERAKQEKQHESRSRSFSESYDIRRYTPFRLFDYLFPSRSDALLKEGETAKTAFGIVVVEGYRNRDSMYKVALLDFNAVMYISKENLEVSLAKEDLLEYVEESDHLADDAITSAVTASEVPLGHTQYSWQEADAVPTKDSDPPMYIPIGHTQFSWSA